MRTEYPRPSLKRDEQSYRLLNGTWSFCDGDLADESLFDAKNYAENITIPFVPESQASGIGRYTAGNTICYLRDFELSESDLARGRALLHFGAVDWKCDVAVNGIMQGSHSGGYTPFYFDITQSVRPGKNTVAVRATDDTASDLQSTGKQCERDITHGCVYTRCTGIWQTVWIEFVPDVYVENIFCIPDISNELVMLDITLQGDGEYPVSAEVLYKGETVSFGECTAFEGKAAITLPVPDPHLWDIGKGELYDVAVKVGDDCANTYFGMREIKIDGKKIRLNGRSIFMRLLLDQGYNPQGIYTAPDTSDFKRDIELMQAAGFNGARMHEKIFEPEYIRAADEAGFLLWGEYPNWGLDETKKEAIEVIVPEWAAEIERDRNCPSIIGWCPFNECDPGHNVEIFKTVRAVTRELDPTRMFIDSSGWIHRGGTDVYDVHDYEQDPDILRERYAIIDEEAYVSNLNWGNDLYDGKMPYFISEFGGAALDIDSDKEAGSTDGTFDGGESGWGYGEAPKTSEELFTRFKALCELFMENHDICGFCYTQFYDIMQEINGIYTYDRRPKFDVSRAKQVLDAPAAIED